MTIDHERLHRCAKELLENYAFQQITDSLTERYISQILASNPKDIEKREDLYRRIKAIKEIKSYIDTIVVTSR